MTAVPSGWDAAVLTARLFASAPLGAGLHLRGGPGPARDAFLAMLRALLPTAAMRRCPAGVTEDRLLGGLDLGATLAAGRAVAERGLLAEADGGLVLLSAPDRLPPGGAARLAAVLDAGEVLVERDGIASRHSARIGLLLLDDGDDPPAATLLDRMAFRLDLDGVRAAAVSMPAPASFMGTVRADPEIAAALCGAAEALGIGSARAVLLALRVAKAVAALDGRESVTADDAALAAALVLAHRATRLPAPPQEAESQETESREAEPQPTDGDSSDDDGNGGVDEAAATVLAAAVAALPKGLLSEAATGQARDARATGRAPGRAMMASRGRPAGSRPGRPDGKARLALVDTLRAAVPWQRLRRPSGASRLAIRLADLRVRRCEATPRTTAIFLVDASGSAALHRLAEAKGAVELLLADCYVRRDQVALLAFRGVGAELLLPPTRALARARRCLGALPGGGGTPLAAGLDAAALLATGLRSRGESPLLVVLTDGRANVALDGKANRERAMADALASARRVERTGINAMLIDISPRPQPAAVAVAAAMGARCLALPQADAAALSRAVRAAA